MTAFQNLFNEGKLNIVQSVGYPQPSFSHFRATDIWMSGSDSTQYLNTGWAGRYLDNEYPNYPEAYPSDQNPDPLAIQIGSITSLTCQGPVVNMGVSISAKQTNKYAIRIKAASDSIKQQVTYPNNSLASQLKIVARLIKGGLKTKVYMVNYGGFDTHAGQTNSIDTTIGPHATLLNAVSEAVNAFQNDIKGLEIDDRVIGMTYSEFGRRTKSNASGGTDHGAAAPLFLFGKNVRGGVFGKNPDLPITATTNDNIPYQTDFRSIYNSILTNWFCVNETDNMQVMLKKYPTLPLFNASVCGVAMENSTFAGNTMISNYPNPFSAQTRIEFKTAGGATLVQLLDTSGTVIKILVDMSYPYAGMNSVTLFGSNLPAGVYYLRLQNGINQYVKTIIKM
jgi:uncharacterized protein (DUF1501 family)